MRTLIEGSVLRNQKPVKQLERELREWNMKKMTLRCTLLDHTGQSFPRSWGFYVVFIATRGERGYGGFRKMDHRLVRDSGAFTIATYVPPVFTLQLQGFSYENGLYQKVQGEVPVEVIPGRDITAFILARQEKNTTDITRARQLTLTDTAGSVHTNEEGHEGSGEVSLIKDILKIGGKFMSKEIDSRSDQHAAADANSTAIRTGGSIGTPELKFEKVTGALQMMR
jgi:hypothetical protein